MWEMARQPKVTDMGRITALLLGICAALTLGTSAARAGTWQFVETSCSLGISFAPPPQTVPCTSVPSFGPLPQVLGTFSSPDQIGSYQFTSVNGVPTGESGDTNFTFHWPFAFTGGPINLPSTGCDCDFTIDWNGPPTMVRYFQFSTSTEINIGVPTRPDTIGSDGTIDGCPNPSNTGGGCTIGGFWDPVGVPEASSVSLLGVLLALLALLRRAGMRPSGRAHIADDLFLMMSAGFRSRVSLSSSRGCGG